MHVTWAAAQVLQNVIDRHISLDAALDDMRTQFDGNIPELMEITFGSCRFYICLDSMLASLLEKPLKDRDRVVHFLLVSALYQIEYMGSPDYAVVNQTVESLLKTRHEWAKGLVNGVLRNFLRNRRKIVSAAKDESSSQEYVVNAFPKHIFDRIKEDWPADYNSIIAASNERPPLTLRVNQRMISRPQYELELQESGVEYDLTSDSTIGVTLKTPSPVDRIPGFGAGRVSVQDESAQLIPSAIGLAKNQRVLDGCAAPGGKTCLMLETRSDLDCLVAVDLPARVSLIKQNLARLKLAATVVPADIQDTASWWDGEPFDRVLLDVPCSGSGVIRRHPDIKHRRKPADFEKFSSQQLSIINSVWPLIKPGGKMMYVTCSIFALENDDVIRKFLNDKEDFELQSLDKKLGKKMLFGRQRIPGIHSGDGFYYCCINKTIT